MSKIWNVAVIVGSLRKESFNRKIANALAELAPDTLKLGIVEIGALALYNEDVEKNAPAAWLSFRKEVKSADAVIFITPEYNRSMPAAMKNAIDVGSRPYGASAWDGKPAAVISVSPGGMGGFGANHHLRQSLVFLNMPALPHEAYIAHAAKLFDESGKLANDSTKEFLQKFLQRYVDWVTANRNG